jgi:crossover junction endodeoxyribonuclease RuvC
MSAAPTVRILGIDPGLRFTGFGVLEKTGSRLQYIASGCVSTQRKDGSEALAPRL